MTRTVGILLAAGNATRMGENKMFMRIGDKSVIERSLLAFQKSGSFDKVVSIEMIEAVGHEFHDD